MLKLSTFFILFILFSCSNEINSPYRKLSLPDLEVLSVEGIDKVVNLDDEIKITFNTNLGVKTIYKSIKCKSGNNYASLTPRYAKKESGDIVTLKPYYIYLPYVKYNCEISTELTDLYGVHLKKAYKFSFSTSNIIFKDKVFKKENYHFYTVRGIINSKCIYCHNEKHKLNFKIDNLDELLIQNYIIPNNARESYLIRKLLGIDFDGKKMPADGSLSIYQIEKFFGWIETLE